MASHAVRTSVLTIGQLHVPLRHMWQWLKRLSGSKREFRVYRVLRCNALCPFNSGSQPWAMCCYPGQSARDIPTVLTPDPPEWCPLRKTTLAVYYEAPSE